ncbi:MAG TPA: uroporphyrinogen-III C-methyltransferase [Polyangiaceae bacterium]|nr:uroporphyrinogen-III C-methyltransferase [Polyangiaceae bacterium]
MTAGKVWLIGAGPGEPGLITVRGLELLSQADVVLHDALAHPALLDVCAQAERRNVGKRFGEPSSKQEEINSQLIELARQGKRVVRLKGGDPLMFARGSEEALALARAGIEFEIVPGVSSPVAATAYAGISLTHRELSSSVTFITGSDRVGKEWSPEAWRKLATATDTICILMGMWRLEPITRAIIEGGRDPETPAAVIQWGARPAQRVVTATLATLAERVRAEQLTNPAIIVVGDVVRLREELRWYDVRPLFGKRMLLPRALEQSRATAQAVRERGAEPVIAPAIAIDDPPDVARFEAALGALADYDWVLFTSANGVERAFAGLARLGRDARAFGKALIGAIGPKTAEALVHHGIKADLVANEYVGEELARAVIERGARRVLVLRALKAREALPDALRQAGSEVDVVAAYQTVPSPEAASGRLRALVEAGEVDVALFTSSSTVENLCDALGAGAADVLKKVTVASIGPITTKTALERGLRVDVTATTYTVAGVLDALEQHFKV